MEEYETKIDVIPSNDYGLFDYKDKNNKIMYEILKIIAWRVDTVLKLKQGPYIDELKDFNSFATPIVDCEGSGGNPIIVGTKVECEHQKKIEEKKNA